MSQHDDYLLRGALRRVQVVSVVRHHGPGPHPGTGTSQDVHGRGDGGITPDGGVAEGLNSLATNFLYRESKASVHFDQAIEDLDSVFISSETLGSIKVSGYSGRGDGKFNPENGKIQINNRSQYHEFTFVHEVGHAMDYLVLPSALGIEGKTATLGTLGGSPTRMDSFWQAIENSDAIKKLQAMRGDDPDGIAYLLDVREVHSRAFSQYVAEASGSRILLDQLDQVREYTWYPEQWSAKDFVPIKRALDNLYGDAGLLR